jgi:plasmid stabilization system protein ParE
MNPRIQVSPAAGNDLEQTAFYVLDRANLETALRWYDATEFTFEKLTSMPGLGEVYEPARGLACGTG